MRLVYSACWLAVALRTAMAAVVPAFDREAVFGVVEENDMVVRADRHYTQGIKMFYFHEDGGLPLGSRILYDRLPEVGFTRVTGRLGYTVGQNIYTPADITLRTLQPKDRPYAGWLYLGTVLQRKGWSFRNRVSEEDFALDMGVIGPWALGEEAQTWVHEIRALDIPRGWDFQQKNEPGIRAKYTRSVRLYEWGEEDVGFDFTPRAGFSLGNLDTSARLGAMIRLGFNLPDDFGYRTIDSLSTRSGGMSRSQFSHWSVYVFGALEGRAVLFNQTLDGSLFHDSSSVNKKEWVGDAIIGFAMAWKNLEAGYAHTFRSPEFSRQSEHDSFGSVFGTWRF